MDAFRQVFSQFMGGQNPSAILQQMASQNPASQNPMAARALQMAQGKTDEQIKQICENLCQQKGINFSEVMKNFRNMMGQG